MRALRLRQLKLVPPLAVLLLTAPTLTRGDATSDAKAHLQQLIDQAEAEKDGLGGDLVNALSLGGLEMITLADMGPSLLGALDAKASNPFESVDFISRLAGSTQSEESVGWCGENAIVGFNDSGSFVKTLLGPPPSPSGSFSFNGWSASTDGGKDFVDKGILISDPLPAGSKFVDLFGDPSVGCTDANTFYYASLATDTHTVGGAFSAISVSKSTNGGQNFGGAKIAVEKPAGHNLDKEWLDVRRVGAVDHIFISYTDFFVGAPCPPSVSGTKIELVRSLDGGVTWSAPIAIDGFTCGTPFVQGSHVAVGNGSDVYVAYESYPFGTSGAPGRSIKIVKSTNEGLSFGAPVTVSSVAAVGSGFYVQGFFRDFLDFQGLVVDKTGGPNNGNVYITWQDGRNLNQTDPFSFGCILPPGHYCFGDILSTRSTNGGATWSAPIRVNDDPITLKADQLFPAAEVDKDGNVVVVFYDRRRDSRNTLIDTYIATSDNGGLTWENERVTDRSFAPIHDEDVVVNTVYMGDYLGIAADRTRTHGGVIVAWGDNSRGDPNVLTAKKNGSGGDN